MIWNVGGRNRDAFIESNSNLANGKVPRISMGWKKIQMPRAKFLRNSATGGARQRSGNRNDFQRVDKGGFFLTQDGVVREACGA